MLEGEKEVKGNVIDQVLLVVNPEVGEAQLRFTKSGISTACNVNSRRIYIYIYRASVSPCINSDRRRTFNMHIYICVCTEIEKRF